MRRRIIFTLLIIMTGWQAAMAQGITGKVVDKEGKALQYVNCVLRNTADSTYLDGAVTRQDGTFSLAKPTADCTLRLSMIGYESKEIANPSGDLGTITLQADSMTLNEVVVKGETPLITMKDNVLTYNTDKILAKRNITNAHELLKELPSVMSLDGESIELVGAQNTTVFISGKQKQMTLEYLKSLPADQVEKVEIIYNAPPEWHVDGSVINVVLKKSDRYTLNGMLQAGYQNQHANTYYGVGSLFASTPHWNYEFIYTYMNARALSQNTVESHHTLDDTLYDIYSQVDGKTKSQYHSVYASVGRDVGEKGDITLSYTGQFYPTNKTNSIGRNSYFGNSINTNDVHTNMHYADLTYTNGKGTKAGVSYMNYYIRNLQALSATNTEDVETSSLDNDGNQRVGTWHGYVDVRNDLSHGWSLYYGGDYTYTNTKNRQTQVTDLGNLEDRASETNLEEHTADLYAAVRKGFWDGKLSLYASLKGNYYKANDYKKHSLLPTAQITLTPSRSHIFQFYYSMWRNYPSYWQISDFITYSDAYTRNEGNSALKPSLSHYAMMNYALNGKYTFQIFYMKVNDFQLYQGYQSDEDLALVYKMRNINYAQTVEMTATIPVTLWKWWDMNIALTGAWQDFKADDWNGLYFNRHKWLGIAVLNNTLTLSKKPKLQANVMAFYRTGPLQGFMSYDHNGGAEASLRLTFLKDKGTLSVGCTDIFQTYNMDFHQNLGTQNLTFNWGRFVNRTIYVRFSYKINGYKERSHQEVDTSRLGM